MCMKFSNNKFKIENGGKGEGGGASWQRFSVISCFACVPLWWAINTAGKRGGDNLMHGFAYFYRTNTFKEGNFKILTT